MMAAEPFNVMAFLVACAVVMFGWKSQINIRINSIKHS